MAVKCPPADHPDATSRLASAPKLGQTTGESVDPGVDFRDDLFERRVGRERIADQRHIDAVGHRACRKQRKGILRPHLPIAAMDKQQRWRIRRRLEEVDPVALARTVLKIEMRAVARPHFRREFLPAFDHVPAAGDRCAVVEATIEHLLAQGAPIKRVEWRGHGLSPNTCLRFRLVVRCFTGLHNRLSKKLAPGEKRDVIGSGTHTVNSMRDRRPT